MSERLSYDLDPELIRILGGEFDARVVAGRFAEGLRAGKGTAGLAEEIFGAYGEAWARRTLELGEKYTDQTYENLKNVARRVKSVFFPHVPQRFVEIGYLATQPFETLAVQQNNHRAFVFSVPDCAVHAALKEQCGEETADSLPCQEACLAFNRTIYRELNLEVNLEMTAVLPVDGFCRFAAVNPGAG